MAQLSGFWSELAGRDESAEICALAKLNKIKILFNLEWGFQPLFQKSRHFGWLRLAGPRTACLMKMRVCMTIHSTCKNRGAAFQRRLHSLFLAAVTFEAHKTAPQSIPIIIKL